MSLVSTEIDDAIAIVTLNRPEAMNALSKALRAELAEAMLAVASDDAVRAVVLTGAGQRAFTAGLDLKELGASTEGLGAANATSPRDNPVKAVEQCTKPVIGAINGAAVGIGATMTLAMDFRLASEKARIGFVFGKLGIVPEACSSWFLPRIVGLQTALEWTYSAEILDAQTARDGGLVKSVHAPEDLLPAAHALAHKFVDGKSPVAIALTRQMMYRNSAQPHPLEAHRVDSLAMFYTSIQDGKEGVQAFLEKRPPEFRSSTRSMPPFYPW
jgi:enoyl-CoA hydratase/carnithine racemase